MTRADPKTVEELQTLREQLAYEAEIRERTELSLAKTTSERDGYKGRYEAKQAVIDKQWKQCKVAAEAAPSFYLYIKEYGPEFCTAMDVYIVAHGIKFQEEVDAKALSLKDPDALFLDKYSRLCSGYEILPHDPLGPWGKK